jgi:serine/threonine-protein kinase RsbT
MLPKMSEVDAVIQTLERYLSPLNARSLVQRALRGTPGSKLSPKALADLVAGLQKSIRLFLVEPELSRAVRELGKLSVRVDPKCVPSRIAIATESDIITARMEARRICDELGAKSFEIQKVTTVVSELARNIISYATGGQMEIVPVVQGTSRRIVIRATDQGPGIPHLAKVLSGDYQSRTGLGRGLLGTKRLAAVFDIATGAGGTTIVAEIAI